METRGRRPLISKLSKIRNHTRLFQLYCYGLLKSTLRIYINIDMNIEAGTFREIYQIVDLSRQFSPVTVGSGTPQNAQFNPMLSIHF